MCSTRATRNARPTSAVSGCNRVRAMGSNPALSSSPCASNPFPPSPHLVRSLPVHGPARAGLSLPAVCGPFGLGWLGMVCTVWPCPCRFACWQPRHGEVAARSCSPEVAAAAAAQNFAWLAGVGSGTWACSRGSWAHWSDSLPGKGEATLCADGSCT